MHYFKGTENHTADLLSRWGAPAFRGDTNDPNENRINMLIEEKLRVIFPSELVNATTNDDVLSTVLKYVQHGWPAVIESQFTPWLRARNELSTWYDGCCLVRDDRAVVPVVLRSRVLDLFHDGHQGIVRCKGIAKALVVARD